jgi:hypothetical protein
MLCDAVLSASPRNLLLCPKAYSMLLASYKSGEDQLARVLSCFFQLATTAREPIEQNKPADNQTNQSAQQ